MKSIMKMTAASLLLLVCLAAGAPGIHAGEPYKVVESSGKRPSWTDSSQEGYIIVSAERPELNAARDECHEQVKRMIVNSIAVSISSSSEKYAYQTSDGSSINVRTDYSSRLTTVAAQLPYITGIDFSGADIYWEKRYVRKEKRYYYNYNLRYSFPASRRQSLVNEFIRIDDEKQALLDDIRRQYDELESVEQIARCITELKGLRSYFFDEPRIAQANSLIGMFTALYGQIGFTALENVPGRYTYCLTIGSRRLGCAVVPKASSDYARNFVTTYSPEDKSFTLTYDYDGATADDDNIVTVTANIGNTRKTNTFRFRPDSSAESVRPAGTVGIEAAGDAVSVSMNLDCSGPYTFVLLAVRLEISEAAEAIEYSFPSGMRLASGSNPVRFTADAVLRQGSRGYNTDGYAEVMNTQTGEVSRIRLHRPYTISGNIHQ